MPTNWTSYDIDRAVFENFARLQGCAANDHIEKSKLWSECDNYSKYGPYDASWERPKPWTADQTAQLEHQLHMRLRKRRREEYCIFHGATRHSTSTCPNLVHGDLSTAEIVSELRRHDYCLCCLEKHVGLNKCGGRCLEPDCSNPDTHHVRLHWAFVDKPRVVERSNVNVGPQRTSCHLARPSRLTCDLEQESENAPAPSDRKSKSRPLKLKKTMPVFVQSPLPLPVLPECEEQCTPLPPALSESRFSPQHTPSKEPTSPNSDLSGEQSAHLPELSDQQYSSQYGPSEEQSSSQPDLSEEQLSSRIELFEEKHDPSDEQSESAYLIKRTVDSDPSAPAGQVELNQTTQPELVQSRESEPESEYTVESSVCSDPPGDETSVDTEPSQPMSIQPLIIQSQSSARPDPPDVESTAAKDQSVTQRASTADEEHLDRSAPRTESTAEVKVSPQPVPEVDVAPSPPQLELASVEEQSLPSTQSHLVDDVRFSSRPDCTPVEDDQSPCSTQAAIYRDPSVSPVEHAVNLHQPTQSHLTPDKSSSPVPTHETTAQAKSGLTARRTENRPQHNTGPKNSQITDVPLIGLHDRIANSVKTFERMRESGDFWHLKSGTLILRLFRIGASFLPP